MKTQPGHVPPLSQLQRITHTKRGLPAKVNCTVQKRTWAYGTVTNPQGKIEQCSWDASGKCYHDHTGFFDLDYSTVTTPPTLLT